MDECSFADSARAHLDKYQVPDGPARDIFSSLGEIQDLPVGALGPLDLIVMQKTFQEMHSIIADMYRPRSPLEAQLEYDRARNDIRNAMGVDWPDWVAADDPVILERWNRWNQREPGHD